MPSAVVSDATEQTIITLGDCDAALQKHMQVQCAKGLDEVKKVKESGNAAPDAVALKHSNEVLNVHKACLTVAEEKVFLATQTYDLVSTVICTALSYLCYVSVCLVCGAIRYFHRHSVDFDIEYRKLLSSGLAIL